MIRITIEVVAELCKGFWELKMGMEYFAHPARSSEKFPDF